MLYRKIKELLLSKERFNKEWRKINVHNFTRLTKEVDFKKVEVGKGTYGPLEIISHNHPDEKLEIGNFCSIAKGVKFILGGNHNYNHLSTYPFSYFYKNEKATPGLTKGKIVVGDDVWIGIGATILSGVNIGQGSIIGSMSVVSKDIPPYAIVAGNPVRIIKYRFEDELIQKLLESNIFDKIDRNYILSNIDIINKNLNIQTLNNLISCLK